ncbi:hypothetical protein BU23DRAFT_566070 [Bimuria novae-zelandiae CBS 107.79]|uniref:Ribosomal RNA-processing protein 8 n=1 Tax=Bimuria novae-zelandiae CBS 107.79 TaxID=1447943 RepID=A0A6A5VIZ9_9PLEO|nr:hypothetical protein BU23DRAFT_566070 [Bimuria novae-zelandiae CBS 107.79]
MRIAHGEPGYTHKHIVSFSPKRARVFLVGVSRTFALGTSGSRPRKGPIGQKVDPGDSDVRILLRAVQHLLDVGGVLLMDSAKEGTRPERTAARLQRFEDDLVRPSFPVPNFPVPDREFIIELRAVVGAPRDSNEVTRAEVRVADEWPLTDPCGQHCEPVACSPCIFSCNNICSETNKPGVAAAATVPSALSSSKVQGSSEGSSKHCSRARLVALRERLIMVQYFVKEGSEVMWLSVFTKTRPRRIRPTLTPPVLFLASGLTIMFSVPGWNVSATLATQVEKPKPQDPEKQGKKAKKRKQKQEVDAGNVGELWDKVIGGKKRTASEKHEAVKAQDEPTKEGAQEQRGKKRKRKDKKGHAEGDSGSKEGTHEAEDAQASAGVGSVAETTTKPKDGESKRDKKKEKRDNKKDIAPTQTSAEVAEPSAALLESLLPPEPKGLTPLQKSMRQKLAGARFRHLNETLYTKPSADSLALFKEDPSMFEDYHRGFAMQTEGWPENPVDVFFSTILTRGKVQPPRSSKDKKHKDKPRYRDPNTTPLEEPTPMDGGPKPLPRNLKGHCTIADLGCGTASLSYRLQPHLKSLNMHINSYDLSKPTGPSHDLVTVADISALPCGDASVDVAVFCLALMGTNWLDFIDEAYRILRWRGELWVAEIKSRFGRVEKAKGSKGSGKPPINSIGSLRKGGPKPPKKQSEQDDDGEIDSADEAELATRIDGAAAKEGTDVSAFVDVLRKHGFVLDALPEQPSAAIDLGNKMFVKMQFVKAAQPSKGKNVKESVNGLRMGMKGKKFAAVEDDDVDDAENAKVLKPCLYKIR